MPDSLYPSVWWILIGGNDLNIGQCSEEVVVLGILRLAESISEQKPGAMIVINSILPALTTVKPRMKTAHFKEFDLFPSIQVINEQLEKFCEKHATFQFFDATPLFSSPPSNVEGEEEEKGLAICPYQPSRPISLAKMVSLRWQVTRFGVMPLRWKLRNKCMIVLRNNNMAMGLSWMICLMRMITIFKTLT
jgi:hypothetical protein